MKLGKNTKKHIARYTTWSFLAIFFFVATQNIFAATFTPVLAPFTQVADVARAIGQDIAQNVTAANTPPPYLRGDRSAKLTTSPAQSNPVFDALYQYADLSTVVGNTLGDEVSKLVSGAHEILSRTHQPAPAQRSVNQTASVLSATTDFFNAGNTAVRDFWGNFFRVFIPTEKVKVPNESTPPPVQENKIATTTAPTAASGTLINQVFPIRERIVERVIERAAPAPQAGVSQDTLDQKLNQLSNALKQEIYQVGANATRQSDGNFAAIALTQRIDKLATVAISNATITGSTFSGSLAGTTGAFSGALSATTGNFSDLLSAPKFSITGTGTSTILGDAAFDASTLYVDSVNHRVGIATTSPTDIFSVNGPIFLGNTTPTLTANRLYSNANNLYWAGNLIGGASTGNWTLSGSDVYRATGNVGIGTTTPTSKLSVEGSSSLGNSATAGYFVATTTTNNTFPNLVATNATTTNATSTNSFATTASSTNLFTSNFSIGSLSGFLKATVGAVSSALVNLVSDVSGILGVGNGGTGWSNIQSGAILYGNGTGALATTTQGTAGQILTLQGGIPTWTTNTGNILFSTTTANSFNQLQQFNANASTTQLTTTGSSYLATLGGSVGIGTTSPSQALSVQGNGLFSGNVTLANLITSGAATIGGALSAASASFATALPVSSGGTGATTLTGLVKGNGAAAFTAATAGIDYVAPSTTVNGHSLAANVSVALSDLADATVTSPVVDQILKWNGSRWINGATVSTLAGSGVNYFYSSTLADVSPYQTLQRSPDTAAEVNEFVTVNNSTALIDTYISPATGIGNTQIDAGVWTFNTYATSSAASGTNTINYNVYKRTSGGIETFLFAATSTSITNTAPTLFQTLTVQPIFSVNASDRLVIKVTGTTNNVTPTTVSFIHSGNLHYSFINTPLILRHNDLASIQGGATGEEYHLSLAEYTGTGTGTFVKQVAPSVTTSLGVAGSAGGVANVFSISTSTAGFATSTVLTVNQNGALSLLNGAGLTVSGNTTHTGTLTQSGLATFTNGFLSNAAATIASGLFSMNGGASTTQLTTSGTAFLGSLGGASFSPLTANYLPKWNSGTFANSLIYDNGTNVGIGTALPTHILDIPSFNTTNSQLRVGGLEHQAYSLNNAWIGENIYFDGTVFRARATGASTLFYFFGNEGQFRSYDSATAGASLGNGTTGINLKTGTGGFGVGVNMSPTQGNYTGSQLFVRASDGNTGIGTTTPLSKLAISGSASVGADYNIAAPTNGLLVEGNVGIGTTNPTAKLQVSGTNDFLINPSQTVAGDIRAGTAISTAGTNSNLTIIPAGAGTAGATISGAVFNGATWRSVWESSNVASGEPVLSLVKSGGNVGIGTTSPSSLLTLAGTAKQLQIDENSTGNSGILFSLNSAAKAYIGPVSNISNYITSSAIGDLAVRSQGGGILFSTDGGANALLTLRGNNGNVGIGTMNPAQKLSIVGTAGANDMFDVASSTGASVLRINSAGNVGIGTTNPLYQLHLAVPYAKTDTVARFGNALISSNDSLNPFGLVAAVQGGASDAVRSVLLQTGQFNLSTAGNIALQPYGGNVGVGTTSPGYKLQVYGGAAAVGDASGNTLIITTPGISGGTPFATGVVLQTGGSTQPIAFMQGASTSMVIGGTGNVGIGTTTPGALLSLGGINPVISIDNTATGGQLLQFTRGQVVKGMIGVPGIVDGLVPGAAVGDLVLRTQTQKIMLSTDGGNTSAVTINTTGNVGIGTTTPRVTLEVANATAGYGAIILGAGTGNVGRRDWLLNASGQTLGNLDFQVGTVAGGTPVGTTPVMSLTSAGNLGIGTIGPVLPLQVKSNGAAISQAAQFTTTDWTASVGSTFQIGHGTSTGNTYTDLRALTNGYNAWGNLVMQSGGGNVGIGTTTPGVKLNVAGPDDGSMQIRMQGTAAPSYYWEMGRESQLIGDFHIKESVAGAVSDRLVIKTTSGNVGIGTVSPNHKLQVSAPTTYGDLTTGYTLSLANNAPTGVNNSQNTNVGVIQFGDSTVANSSMGRISVVQTSPLNSTGSFMQFFTNSGGGNTAVLEKMRIDSAGNVGIGTTAPSGQLTVQSPNGTLALEYIRNGDFVQNTTGSGLYLGAGAATGNTYSQIQAFTTGNSVAGNLVLNPGGGNVGIATTTPWKTLSVVGTMAINGLTTSTAGNAVCITAGFEVVTAGNTTCVTSSQKTKDNILSITSEEAQHDVLGLVPSVYTNKEKGDRRFGFIAEQANTVDARIVEYASENRTLPDGLVISKGEPSGFDYLRYPAVLTKFVQDLYASSLVLIADVKDLTNKVSNLISRVASLEIFTQNQMTNGVTTKDRLTGEDYCMFISGGTMQTVKGACSVAQIATVVGAAAGATVASTTPITLQIHGNNPATVMVRDTYGDLGASITAPLSAQNLGIKASVDGGSLVDVSQVSVDTSVAGIHHIVYTVVDQNSATTTAERILNVVSFAALQQAQQATTTSAIATSTATSTAI